MRTVEGELELLLVGDEDITAAAGVVADVIDVIDCQAQDQESYMAWHGMAWHGMACSSVLESHSQTSQMSFVKCPGNAHHWICIALP